jgi:hypothetical protein
VKYCVGKPSLPAFRRSEHDAENDLRFRNVTSSAFSLHGLPKKKNGGTALPFTTNRERPRRITTRGAPSGVGIGGSTGNVCACRSVVVGCALGAGVRLFAGAFFGEAIFAEAFFGVRFFGVAPSATRLADPRF